MSENLIGQIITAVVTIALALIGYLKLKGGQDKLREDVDGKMTQLLEVTGAKERAEAKEDSAAVTDVKIVDQTDPVKVVTEKPDKNKPT